MCDKPNIILDLDNTILCSLTPKEVKDIKEDYLNNLKHTNFKRYYKIFHRPYLQEFLDYIFNNFNVSVWTAGSKDYCLFIVENIIYEKPNRQLKLILYDSNCNESEKKFKTDTPKDLRYIFKFDGFNKNNSFIVDDLIDVYKYNKDNVLRAKYFDVLNPKSVNDVFLKDCIPILENMLKKYYKDGCNLI